MGDGSQGLLLPMWAWATLSEMLGFCLKDKAGWSSIETRLFNPKSTRLLHWFQLSCGTAWQAAPLAEQCSEKVNPWLSLLMLCSRSSQVNLGITPKSPVLMNMALSSHFHSCAPGHWCTWAQKSLGPTQCNRSACSHLGTDKSRAQQS